MQLPSKLKLIVLFVCIYMLSSCGQKKGQQQDPGTPDTSTVDSAAILRDITNNLNIQTSSFREIDSSGIIAFPLSIGEHRRDKSGYSYKEIPSSNYWNIIFYNSHTSSYHLLTDRKILITNDLGYDYAENTPFFSGKHLYYEAIVDDYNNDKVIDHEDPVYLFVSDKQGKNFRQVSPSGYHLQAWKYLKSIDKVIMSATRDADSNKVFDNDDEVASFQIDVDKESQPSPIFSANFKDTLKLMFGKNWKRIKK